MNLSVVLLVFSLSASVYCRNSKCSEHVAVYGRAKICMEKEWCEERNWSDESDYVLANSTLDTSRYEKATYVKIFPNAASNSVQKCTVQNFQNLSTIYGENGGITVIELNSFWNLPALRTVYLAYNLIAQIQFGIFSNLPVTFLDLSWNKINFVGEDAFAGMKNLQVLNLSHNELVVLDLKLYTDLPLNELIVSHNILEDVGLSPNLNISSMDFSFNKLKCFILDYKKSYKKVDLTNNYLSEFVWSGGSVGDLRLSLNNLTDINILLNNATQMKNVTLFPNPWDCTQINTFLNSLKERNVTVVHPAIDKRLTFVRKNNNYPICVVPDSINYNNYHNLRQEFIKHDGKSCDGDNQCPSSMICRTRTCWEPCKNNACKNNFKRCSTKDHRFSCKCPLGQLSKPFELFSRCYFPCFTRADCPIREDEYRSCDERNHFCLYKPFF